MGKVLFWIVVLFVVLFAIRMIGIAQAKKRRERDAAAGVAGPMVRCKTCGVYLPRAEAVKIGDAFHCNDQACLPK